jgi:hypothetical protein
MPEDRPRRARVIATFVVLGHLVATLIAIACLGWLGNPESFGVTLAERILWAVWIVHALAQVLTRVTIFGWNFRRYFRPSGDERPPAPPLRPTRAPWYKSGTVSFTTTVFLVALTGACGLAILVMYTLKGVVGDRVYWLVCMIIFCSWWPLVIAAVIFRVALFGKEKKRAKQTPATEKPEPSLAGQQTSEEG